MDKWHLRGGQSQLMSPAAPQHFLYRRATCHPHALLGKTDAACPVFGVRCLVGQDRRLRASAHAPELITGIVWRRGMRTVLFVTCAGHPHAMFAAYVVGQGRCLRASADAPELITGIVWRARAVPLTTT